jgi:hypothetical protein
MKSAPFWRAQNSARAALSMIKLIAVGYSAKTAAPECLGSRQ